MNDREPPTGLPLVLLASELERGMHWLERSLDSGGYAVLRERTGRHTLQRARAIQLDVIIVDEDLRDQTGVEVCGALRHDAALTSSTPILLCSSAPLTREQRLAALRAGAWECISPPHDIEEVLLKVDAFARAKLDADRARAEGLLDAVTGLYNRQGLVRRARELGSQAFRDHGALACVVLALDLGPGDAASEATGEAGLGRCVQALRSTARLSDVVGRLSPAEFAVLAPGTDASGARRLAERLAGNMHLAMAPQATGAGAVPPLRVRCGYEAIANVGYAPIEPMELLVRASTALRTGRAEPGGWIRRFDNGLGATPP
ncbi:MAG TPA: diguanylate cyclase [Gemmatimonadales bacterium]|nr:diguanylate cyclase [Gemmatimonadales bacterium]